MAINELSFLPSLCVQQSSLNIYISMAILLYFYCHFFPTTDRPDCCYTNHFFPSFFFHSLNILFYFTTRFKRLFNPEEEETLFVRLASREIDSIKLGCLNISSSAQHRTEKMFLKRTNGRSFIKEKKK